MNRAHKDICPTCSQPVGSLPVWLDGNVAIITGERYRLTPTETDILQAIVSRHPRVAPHEAILQDVYGLLLEWPSPQHFRVRISQIRRKLAGAPIAIESVWGRGYRLIVEEQKERAA